MADHRKPRDRLTRDSDWVRRLNDVVERAARVSVFTGQPPGAPALPAARTAAAANRQLVTRPEGWGALGEVRPRTRKLRESGAPLVSFYRDDPVAHAFDVLRTRLVQTLRQNGWRRVAVAAPDAGGGTTFTAVNLALSLGRIPGSRTLLMDMNQKRPGVAAALDIGWTVAMREFLSGASHLSDHIVRSGETLALGLGADSFQDGADLLHDPVTATIIDGAIDVLKPDVVLYDMPAMLEQDDLGAMLPQLDGVLLVSDGTRTTARRIAECERLIGGRTQLLGVILNRARPPILGRG